MIVKIKSNDGADDLYVDADNEGKLIELNQGWAFLFIDKSQAERLAEVLQKWLAGEEVE